MKTLEEKFGLTNNEYIHLFESIDIIANRKTNIIQLKTKRRKSNFLKFLSRYNLPVASKKTSTYSIVIEDYSCDNFIEIMEPLLYAYWKDFKEVKSKLYNSFFLTEANLNSDNRLFIVYNLLKKLNKSLVGRTSIIYKSSLNLEIKFSFSQFYYLSIVLMEIYSLIKNSRTKSIPYILKDLEIPSLYQRSITINLKNLFRINLEYFNIIRLDIRLEKNYIKIPMAIQKLLDDFELDLRRFLIKILIKKMNKPILSYFPNNRKNVNMFKILKKKAISEMKKSDKNPLYILQFRKSNFNSLNHLVFIFEEMSNNDYIEFIKHNFSFFKEHLGTYNYESELRKIAQLRNIKAHNKTEAERNVSKHLQLMSKYKYIFNKVI